MGAKITKVQSFWHAFLHLVYPALCAHCAQNTERSNEMFCADCLHLLHLLDPSGRCPRCFIENETLDGCACMHCRQKQIPYTKVAAAFEYAGPAALMVRDLKYAGYFSLAKEMAALMVVQWARLDFPLPDAIIPVPQSLARYMTRGYNQSLLIAQEFAKLINRPVLNVLSKKSGEFSQTGLDQKQRNQFNADSIGWKKRVDLSDQNILVIDDVMTTYQTLKSCGMVLRESFPKSLYGLTFCAAS